MKILSNQDGTVIAELRIRELAMLLQANSEFSKISAIRGENSYDRQIAKLFPGEEISRETIHSIWSEGRTAKACAKKASAAFADLAKALAEAGEIGKQVEEQ